MFTRDISNAIFEWRHGTTNMAELTAIAVSGRLGRSVNPNRICTIVEIYNMLIPVIESFTHTTLPPMPVPPQCLTPTPTAEDEAEKPELLRAVFSACFD